MVSLYENNYSIVSASRHSFSAAQPAIRCIEIDHAIYYWEFSGELACGQRSLSKKVQILP